jgi:hypothetical protein
MVRLENVKLALQGLISPDDLSEREQESYFDALAEIQWGPPSSTEVAFFADRRRRGMGVGMDDAGNILDGKASPGV